MRVLIEAPILTRSGYGEHAKLVYQSLKSNSSLDIFINPLGWGTCTWDLPSEEILHCINKYRIYNGQCQQANKKEEYSLQIHVGIPSEFTKKAPYSVCITAGIETDRVSPEWLIKTNQGIDKLIVPSNHAKSGFVNTRYEIINKTNNTKTELGCACPVDVIPYPVKHFSENKLDIDFETEFNFLSIAMYGPRKNIETSIKCFVEEFRDNDNVGLVLKTSMSRSSIIDRNSTKIQVERYVQSLGEKKCTIYLIHGNMTESEIHSLYTHPKIKAYYTTTHGEGYGLPIFEAAYSGLPVIATDWSGHLDFLKANHKGKEKKLFSKINFDLKEVQASAVWDGLITKDSRWAYPKEKSIKSQLSSVFKNHGMYKSWAKSLQKNINDNYTIDKILNQYRVCILGNTDSDDVELNIDELRTKAFSIENVKDRMSFVKRIVSKDISQKDKILFLEGIFKDKKAYIVSCGPTLTDHDPKKIEDLLKDNLAISIKQSYDMFSEFIDFHIYNCANFKKYDYSKNRPVVIEASTSPYRLSECDLKFFIRERDFNNSVAKTEEFDSWTFNEQPLLRPYGPGIMYEVVFYTLQHLGVSEVVTIGWDNKLVEGDAAQQHFYDKKGTDLDKKDFIHSNEVASNPAAVASLNTEGTVSTNAILPWYRWLKDKGLTLKIISSINPAPQEIEREVIE